jgi:glycerol-3-phosphate dehydrogenase subunit B
MQYAVDVLVIGGGMAGAMAALEARRAGLNVMVVRRSLGATAMSSGAINLTGVDRWLQLKLGDHQAAVATLSEALAAFKEHAGASKLSFQGQLNKEMLLINPYGTFTRAQVCLESMAGGDLPQLLDASILFVGVRGYSDFDAAHVARSIVAVSKTIWADNSLKTVPVEVDFPRVRRTGNLNGFDLAQLLDSEAVASEFAQRIATAADLSQYTHVALPPVVGMVDPQKTITQIQTLLGKPCFETVSLPPSVPGNRLQRALDRAMQEAGIALIHAAAGGFECADDRVNRVQARQKAALYQFDARTVVLATGKYIGGGIERSDRLRETVFDLPVFVGGRPEPGRTMAHLVADRFTAYQPIFSAGVRLDPAMRPVASDGLTKYQNVFAAGAINSGVDPTRGDGGLGLCLVSGYLAGKQAARFIKGNES